MHLLLAGAARECQSPCCLLRPYAAEISAIHAALDAMNSPVKLTPAFLPAVAPVMPVRSRRGSLPVVPCRPDRAHPQWGAAIDGTDAGLVDFPHNLLVAGKFNRVPLILGTNLNEGMIFVPGG